MKAADWLHAPHLGRMDDLHVHIKVSRFLFAPQMVVGMTRRDGDGVVDWDVLENRFTLLEAIMEADITSFCCFCNSWLLQLGGC